MPDKPQSWLEKEVIDWQGYEKEGEKPPAHYVALFTDQHGYKPKTVRFIGGGVLVGPLREGDKDDYCT